MPKINIPTLIVTSDHDKLTLPRASEHMAAVIPQSELIQVVPAGHPGFLERGKAYDDAISDFLTRRIGLRSDPRKES